MTNARIAAVFEEIAALLEQHEASAHRIRAWRDAAESIRTNPREMSDVFRDHGRVGLEAIPHLGPRLTNALIELLRSGHSGALERLRGDGLAILEHVPGIGPRLAARIHDELGIETLEELEAAAASGALARIAGFGPRRVTAVRDVLATRLARTRRPEEPRDRPPVELLLAVDLEYRRAAAADELRRIAPRRFNSSGKAWLPVMHQERDGWAITAMFSNTARAHELGRTADWVVVYYHLPHQPEGQATIVTEWRGPAHGQRVVRGREAQSASTISVAA